MQVDWPVVTEFTEKLFLLCVFLARVGDTKGIKKKRQHFQSTHSVLLWDFLSMRSMASKNNNKIHQPLHHSDVFGMVVNDKYQKETLFVSLQKYFRCGTEKKT